jgi:hypothetical protein
MADVGVYTCHPWHFMEFQCLSQYIDELTMPLTIVLKSSNVHAIKLSLPR